MKRVLVLLLAIIALMSTTACCSGKKYNERYSKETISCYEEQLSTINLYFDGKLSLDELQQEFETIHDKYSDNGEDLTLWNAANNAATNAFVISSNELLHKLGSETLAEIESAIKKMGEEIETKLYQ